LGRRGGARSARRSGFHERTLDIFDPNLSKIASVALPKQPRELVVAENYAVDEDGDGFIRRTRSATWRSSPRASARRACLPATTPSTSSI